MTQVLLIPVGDDDADIRLDRWFRRLYPQINQSRLQKLLRTGQVRIDGKRVESSTRLQPGQTVRVPPLPDEDSIPKRVHTVSDRDAAMLRDRVLFRDDWVIVVDKPAGLAVQGGSGTTRHLDGMLDALAFDGERPKLVHRLDRDTSGVLVLARTTLAARKLADSFRGKQARKYYWAATVGVPDPEQGKIDAPISKQPGKRGERMELDDGDDGQSAISLYAVVDSAWKSAAWVALWPLTGRTHQLRVHMNAIGAPILGDLKYGGEAAHMPEGDVGEGLHLHARRIVLPHPGGRGGIDVVAPLPAHMRTTWDYFGFGKKDDGDPFADVTP